jgi:DNA-binding NarL/FixJ family response regulator
MSGEMQKPTRILLVDDHPVVRQGMAVILNGEPDWEVCAEAEGMSQALKCFLDHRPDLVLTDLTLENGSGIELIKELVSMQPDVKVIAISMHDETLYAERVLRAGGKGYLRKDEKPQQMVGAIRCVLDGRIHLSEKMTHRMLSRTVTGTGDAGMTPIEMLTDRELEVLHQIGNGIPTRKIADNLHISHKTVETYRENIKSKLNLANGTELTQRAVRWVLELSPESPPRATRKN